MAVSALLQSGVGGATCALSVTVGADSVTADGVEMGGSVANGVPGAGDTAVAGTLIVGDAVVGAGMAVLAGVLQAASQSAHAIDTTSPRGFRTADRVSLFIVSLLSSKPSNCSAVIPAQAGIQGDENWTPAP